ncbi:MAG TPA: alpha/beta hydrolase [Solirubrobacteraceae bacterium]|jgi:pimeloyl-ACP methyl ester carboxylesterase|nr:alpha/beta hydrolase [Solirubrobacteraceae bacterium]
MPEIELTAGTIDYEDTGGDGPVLVLLGGLVMDGSVWDPLVEELRGEYRCVVPTLPLGAHRKAMRPDADLSLQGFATIVRELLERLELEDVTLVQNDHAAAIVLAGESPQRIARLVISSCEAFENYPPGLPGKNVRATAFVPGGIYLTMQAMRVRALRRLPIAFGWMAKHPLPAELLDRWLEPLQTQAAVRRDFRKYVTSGRRRQMVDVCERLRSFTRPALVVWTPEDKVQRPEHGKRFAALLPDARLVEVADSYTLIMRDQPHAFARAIREFVQDTAAAVASA